MKRLYLVWGILGLIAAGCGDNDTTNETPNDPPIDSPVSVCGDGVVDVAAGEECDDGNLDSGDGCEATCLLPACGDGIVNSGAEECDDGGESATCDLDCTAVACGDSTVNTAAGEDCDDGGESAACDVDCSLAECGDGVVNAAAGEVCDDENTDDLDGCSATCRSDESCGNGVLDALIGETCDDGNQQSEDGCTEACTTEPLQICATDGPLGIDDNGTTVAELVPPFPYLIETLDVELDITHTSLADLTIELSSGATTVVIADSFFNEGGPGSLCTGDDMRAIIDDEAETPLAGACIESGDPAIAGRYRPEGSLSDFDGADVSGTWSLSVTDGTAGDSGTIDRWCLNLNGFGVPTRLAQVYWATSSSAVLRAEVDSGEASAIVSDLSGNFAIAIDPVTGSVYYDSGSPSAITRVDADGSNPEVIVANAGTTFGLAVDPVNGKLYWSDFSGNKVMRADLDGSNPEQIASVGSPSGLDVDIAAGKVYFMTYNSTALHRVNVDGTGQETLIPGLGGQGVDVVVDSAAGKLYYSTRSNDIFVANLDGSASSVLITGQTVVQGLALDVASGTLYWAAPFAGTIRRAAIAAPADIEDVAEAQGNGWDVAFMPAL
ncbi:MAG: DUF4215 domain-containing protein [Myxococcota bacterium]